MKYFLVDPFATPTSGVSSYTEQVCKITNYEHVIPIPLKTGTTFQRLQVLAKKLHYHGYSKNHDIIEVPDSRYLGFFLRNHKIHVRLHCPFEVARKYDSKSVPILRTYLERKGIEIAKHISSPSKLMLTELSHYNILNPTVYPNPISFFGEQRKKVYDIVYLGRWQSSKGVQYVEEVIKKFSDKKFLIITPDKQTKFPKNVVHRTATGQNIYEYLSQAYVAIIPSHFESFSNVALEAIASGVQVVCFSSTGITEYIKPPLVYHCSTDSLENFCDIISSILKNKKNYPNNYFFQRAINDINTKFNIGFNDALKQLMDR